MKSIKESMKAIANAYYEEEISEEEEIRADAVRKFAEWQKSVGYLDYFCNVDTMLKQYEEENINGKS